MKFDIWGAEESWLVNYLNSRATVKIEPTEKELKAFHISRERDDKTPKILKMAGDAAEIRIFGVLSQKGPDYWDYYYGDGGTGYNDIIASIKEIRNNSQIKTVNLIIDSPGGQVNGVDNVWKELMALRKDKKIVAINYGLMASCAYYLASAAHKIHSTSETNEVGSVGVLVAGIDISKMREKEGIKKIVIVSKNAPDKNDDIGTKKGQKILQERVDNFESFFLNRISAGRKLEIDHIAKNFGRGGLLFSKTLEEGQPDALSVKMIDKVLNISTETGASSAPVQFNAKQEKEESMEITQELLDQKLQAKYDEGVTAGQKKGKEKIEAKIQKTFAFLKEETVYPQYIQTLALTVAKGEKSVEALEAVVAVYDAEQEKIKAEKAKNETDKTEETPGDHENKPPDGKINDEESMQAAVKNAKNFI